MKKGQVTVFIIIVIVLVAAAVGYYFFVSESGASELSEVDTKPVENKVQECLENSLINAIRIVGMQGGYFIAPEGSFETDISKIAYGSYEGENTLISIEKMEDEIEDYLGVIVPTCIDGGEFLNDVELGEISVKTSIQKEKVSTELGISFCVSNLEASSCVDGDYGEKIHVRLGDMHGVAKQVIENNLVNPNFIDFTYLSGFDYKISVMPYSKQRSVYMIVDDEIKLDDTDYIFSFAVRE